MPGGLALNATMLTQWSRDASRPNNGLTVRRSGRQMQFGNCTNIESIPICDGGTTSTAIHVTKVALDYIEVAVHQDDSSGVPNTKQLESSWHRRV